MRVNAKVLYIFALPAVAVFVIVLVIGLLIWWPLALLSLPLAALAVWWMYRRSDEALLNSLNARGLGQTEGQRVTSTVENLSLASGIAQPEVMVIDTPACNVAVISGRQDTLVVTTGLLETLNLLEMEGVVAHALSKLSTGAMKYGTLAASAKPFITNGQIETARRWGIAEAGVVTYDISGVGLTRYPPGLRSALEQMVGVSTEISGAQALGDAWFVPPTADKADIGHRIEVLGEL